MKHRARMFKMLAVLVAAMSGTAWLLGRLERDSISSDDTQPADEIVFVAKELAERSARGRWQSVEIRRGRPQGQLTGFAGRDCHLAIDPSGRIHESDNWVMQNELPDANARIVIQCGMSRDDGAGMTRSQWFALHALVTAIERHSPDEAGLAVVLDRSLALAYGMEPGTILQASATGFSR
jgi:hypothetical protein